MSPPVSRGDAEEGTPPLSARVTAPVAPSSTPGGTREGRADGRLRATAALAVLAALLGAAYWLHGTPGRGPGASFSLLTGLALGVVFQRSRFCFFCILRDVIERDSRGMYAILSALAVGGVGYAVVFGSWLPDASTGRLPPDAHIGPVSWVLALAGMVFGLGMTLSGACISSHLYRLGEGYTRAPFALLGTLVGFGLGFLTWRELYLGVLSRAPVPWLPAWFGYGGALALHLALLSVLGAALLRYLPPLPERAGGRVTLEGLRYRVLEQRWPPLVGGALVGLIGMLAYLRVEPLGVTAQLGSVSRTAMSNAGLLAERLPGLDTFAGCATVVAQTVTENGFLIGALVLGAFAAALLGGHFKLSQLTPLGSMSAFTGGVLMGWSAMTALGCTVGTLLSGIMAFSLSGWVFGVMVFAGVWVGLKARLHRLL